MFYKNTGGNTKTYYGVTFLPGQTKEVMGNINDRSFIRVPAPLQPKPSKKPSKATTKATIKPPLSTEQEGLAITPPKPVEPLKETARQRKERERIEAASAESDGITIQVDESEGVTVVPAEEPADAVEIISENNEEE